MMDRPFSFQVYVVLSARTRDRKRKFKVDESEYALFNVIKSKYSLVYILDDVVVML